MKTNFLKALSAASVSLLMSGCYFFPAEEELLDPPTVAVEVMIGTDAIRNLIRSAKINMMETTMAAGGRDGMCTLNDSLAKLYKTGQISYETALEYATDRNEMEKKLLSGI